MPSTIGWLDQSEEQQRRMREVVALFAEPGTVDDIGIGVVRDAFSDLLFPGLSTVQTRLRYFLFVPWVYQRLEDENVSSDRAEERARQWELQLIRSLKATGERDGVIGRDAGDNLRQLPSFAYWNGLRFAGIREFAGTRTDYHRAMNRINDANRRSVRGEGDETVAREPRRWHHNLPERPDDLFETVSLALRPDEAEYLRERFLQADGDSLFAALIRTPRPMDDRTPLPWNAVAADELPLTTAGRLRYARWFSETIFGAQTLYNLMLAELADSRSLAIGEQQLDHYQARMASWQESLDALPAASRSVDRYAFWQLVYGTGARVSPGAKHFIDTWIDLAETGVDLRSSASARELIANRERRLKKGLSRLHNPRALERWLGSSGADQLTYRWQQGRSAVNDIALGLGVSSSA